MIFYLNWRVRTVRTLSPLLSVFNLFIEWERKSWSDARVGETRAMWVIFSSRESPLILARAPTNCASLLLHLLRKRQRCNSSACLNSQRRFPETGVIRLVLIDDIFLLQGRNNDKQLTTTLR